MLIFFFVKILKHLWFYIWVKVVCDIWEIQYLPLKANGIVIFELFYVVSITVSEDFSSH